MKPIELRGHTRPINQVRFNLDGDLFLSAGVDGIINLWNSFTFERMGSMQCLNNQGGHAAVKSVDFSEDSQYVVAGCFMGELIVFDAQTGSIIRRLQSENKNFHLEFSYGNKYILLVQEQIISSRPNPILILDFDKIIKGIITKEGIETNLEKYAVNKFFVPQKPVKGTWNLLNKNIILACNNGSVLLADPLTGKIIVEKGQQDNGHKEEVISLNLAKDFSILATCGKDGAVFWDPENLEVLGKIKQEFPQNAIFIQPKLDKQFHCLMGGGIPARDAALSKKGGFEIHVCNMKYEEEIGTISGHFSPIRSLEISPDGRMFVSGGEEGFLRVYIFDSTYWQLDQTHYKGVEI